MTTSKDVLQKSITKAAKLITRARKAISFTGAGYSTPSGIPDFRSSGSGLWERHNPFDVASLTAFRVRPQQFFSWFRPLATKIIAASPNPAHISLTQLEKAGHFVGVITQNIDGLHQRAGSKQVHEIHGTLDSLTCTFCHSSYDSGNFIESYINEGVIPHCPECSHILKPDVVFFEEQLPLSTWRQAKRSAGSCDLMLVAGSSLQVMPAAGLPMRAVNHGASLIVINHSPTYIDECADVILRGDVAEIIPLITQEVLDG